MRLNSLTRVISYQKQQVAAAKQRHSGTAPRLRSNFREEPRADQEVCDYNPENFLSGLITFPHLVRYLSQRQHDSFTFVD